VNGWPRHKLTHFILKKLMHTRRNEKYFIHLLLSGVWGQHGYQKKQNSSGKSIYLVWCTVSQSKLSKLQKTLKISQKRWKTAIFQWFFWSLFNFGWKTAHQTKTIDFLEEFRFFWYPYCPQTHDNSGAIVSFMFCFEILWWKCPLVFFPIFFKMKPGVI